MSKEKIISVLVGLAGAVANNAKTENTDRVFLKALTFPARCPGAGEGEWDALAEEIRREKFAISPGCATCASPCGNTSDYDMSRLHSAPEEIRRVKQALLEILEQLALEAGEGEDITLLYKILLYVSYDLKLEQLERLLTEARDKLGERRDRSC